MKKLISVVFLFVLSVCLLGCIDNPNGPHTIVPYGVYENEGLISAYPYQVTQEYSSKNKKFEIEEAIPGIVGDALMEFLKKPRIISLDSIKCDSLKELFKINLSAEKIEEEYLKENFKALWFIREEPVDAKELEDIVYLDLFVENKQIYVTINYNDTFETAGEAISYYEDLILIPNDWEEKIGKSSINFNLYNHSYLGNRTIMTMSKRDEFKDAYRKQILDKQYDDQMYREIYMLNVYGIYNNTLVATVTYDGYVHTDVDLTVTDTFEDVSITYDLHYPIWVYYYNKLYTLTEAYNNGYLSIDDLRNISEK